MATEFHAAAEAMLDPEVLADHRRVRSLTAKRLALQPVAERWDAWRAAEREASELQAMGAGTDAEFARMAREELPGVERRADALLAELQRLLVTSDDSRVGAVILEIRAGVGGDEAALWSGDLVEMYRRLAQRRGWTWDEMELKAGDAGGVTQAIVEIEGNGVWTALGYENVFTTDHNSGQFTHPAGGPYLFVNELPTGELTTHPILKVADHTKFAPNGNVNCCWRIPFRARL
jgi:peptide chain release factor 1